MGKRGLESCVIVDVLRIVLRFIRNTFIVVRDHTKLFRPRPDLRGLQIPVSERTSTSSTLLSR